MADDAPRLDRPPPPGMPDLVGGGDPVAAARARDRLDDLRRRLQALGDELAAGPPRPTWRGRARARFDHHVATITDDLAVLVAALGRSADLLDQAADPDTGTRP